MTNPPQGPPEPTRPIDDPDATKTPTGPPAGSTPEPQASEPSQTGAGAHASGPIPQAAGPGTGPHVGGAGPQTGGPGFGSYPSGPVPQPPPGSPYGTPMPPPPGPPPAGMQSGAMQSGAVQSGAMQSGAMQPGGMPPGSMQPGGMQPGAPGMHTGPPPGGPGWPGGPFGPGGPGGPSAPGGPGGPGGPSAVYPGQQGLIVQEGAWSANQQRGTLSTLLAFVPLLAIPIGILVPERGATVWEGAEAWSVFAILCALLQLAPLLAGTFGWSPQQGWRIGAVGVAGLVLFWVLLVLPAIGRNTSFAITIGTFAAVAALWLTPARPR
jgi:hypothetical protein